MSKIVYLIGAGPGARDVMTSKGLELIKICDEVIAPKRIAAIYKNIRNDIVEAGIDSSIERIISSKKNKIGLLVSGDTGFYSISKRMFRELDDYAQIEAIPAVGALQYLSAKTGISYEDMFLTSLHGRSGSLLGAVSYNGKVFALTGGAIKAQDICTNLSENGLGEVLVIIGENLSMDNERICIGTALELSKDVFGDLTSMIIINENFTDRYSLCHDEDFIRGKIPMTKEEIRHLCVSEINPYPEEIVFDIGAGTGSVSVELAKRAWNGMIYAIEKEEEGIRLIKENKEKFGTYNIIPLHGEATEKLRDLPSPDKVFIGGSGGHLEEIIKMVLNKNDKVKIVVTAITLETLSEALNAFKSFKIEPSIMCVNSSKSKKMGRYNMMFARNPVYIISGEKIESKS